MSGFNWLMPWCKKPLFISLVVLIICTLIAGNLSCITITIEKPEAIDDYQDDSFNESGASFEDTFTESDSPFVIYTNPLDPLVFTYETPEGDYIEYWGSKDEEGLVTRFTSIVVTNSEDETSSIDLDDQQRPVRIIDHGGAVYNFDWLSDSRIAISAISANGEVQVKTAVDIGNNGIGSLPNQQIPAESYREDNNSNTTCTCQISSMISNSTLKESSSDTGVKYASSNYKHVEVTVLYCGTPVPDAEVTFEIYPEDEKPINIRSEVNYSPDGRFDFFLPVEKSLVKTKDDLLKTVKNIVSKLDFISGIVAHLDPYSVCLAICGAIDVALGGPTGEGLLILPYCVGAMTAMKAYAATGGKSAPGGKSVSEQLIEKIESSKMIDRALDTQKTVTIGAVARIPGVKDLVFSKTQKLSASHPLPENIVINYEGKPRIICDINPKDPAPGQGYTVKAKFDCIKKGTQIMITVFGDDGYSDHIEKTVSGSPTIPGVEITSGETLSLFVPGAEQGVHDLVSVRAGETNVKVPIEF